MAKVTVQKTDGTKKEAQTKDSGVKKTTSSTSTSDKVKSTVSDVKNRLADAYSKVKPELETSTYGGGKDVTLSLGGNYVGSASKYQSPYGGANSYEIAYKGNEGNNYWNSVNTPIGKFGSGRDDGYNYIQYTSPIENTGYDGFSKGVEYSPNGNDYYGVSNEYALNRKSAYTPNTYAYIQDGWDEENSPSRVGIDFKNLGYENPNIPLNREVSASYTTPFGGNISANIEDEQALLNYSPKYGSVMDKLLNAIARRQ